MDQLTQRNFITVNEALKADRQRLDELEKENKNLKVQLAESNNKLRAMEQKLNILFAKMIGTGATSI